MQVLTEAIQLVEGTVQNQALREAKEMLTERLKDINEENYEDRGTMYYYILRLSLQGDVQFENVVLADYLKKVLSYFQKQEKKYLIEVRKSEKHTTEHKIKVMQTKAFYKLMEKYFSSLEALYRKKDFTEAKETTYREKMRYRKKLFLFTKSYLNYLTYQVLEVTCDYGNSFLRWGITTVVVIVLFGCTYWTIDFAQTGGAMISKSHALYDYFYFSAVAFTTVGFGDIAPITALEKIIASVEALTGYLMIGMFLNLLQKKLY